jgi:very-short-patch-repair endonuclease
MPPKADQSRRRDFKRTFAKSLRATPTDVERLLWSRLRGNHLGLRFRRQQPIGPYIADFFCASARLVVELDGSQHGTATTIVYDEARTRFIEACGYRVLRFANGDVLRDLAGIVDVILAAARPLPEPPRSARRFDPPSGGG